MSLVPPPKVQKLQAALHAKAKASPGDGWANWRIAVDAHVRRTAWPVAVQ